MQDDIDLIINNARLYNKKDSVVQRHAVRIREAAEEILADLDSLDAPTSDPSVLRAQLTELVTPEYLEQLFEFKYDPPPKESLEKEKAVEKETPIEPKEQEEEKKTEVAPGDKEDSSKKTAKEKGKGRVAAPASTSMRASRSKSGGGEPTPMDVDAEGEEEPIADPKAPAVTNNKRRGSSDKSKGVERDAKRHKKGDSPPAAVVEEVEEKSTPRQGMLREFRELGALAATPLVSSRPNPREAARLRAEEAEKQKVGESSRKDKEKAPASLAKGKEKEKEQPKRTERSKSCEEKDPGKAKRGSIDEEELKVADVDPRASFKLFESGSVRLFLPSMSESTDLVSRSQMGPSRGLFTPP